VDVESILGEAEVWSCQARVTVQKGRFEGAITFDPTVGLRSKFYRSFRRPFSMEWMWNRNSMRRRSCRAMLE